MSAPPDTRAVVASIRLRPAAPSDLDGIVAAENHEDNAPYVTQWPRDRHARALADAGMRSLIVERAEDGRPVGYAILAGVEPRGGSVELLRMVITDKGRGYGRAVLRAVKRLAFDELGAVRLWLDVRANNPRARRLYESEGFVVEGTDAQGLTVLSIRREAFA